jgi:hypothetical protein
MSIARYYDADANPEGRVFHGVPLADIEQGTWESLPVWLQQSVDASGMYTKSKPSGKADATRAAAPAKSKRPRPARKAAAPPAVAPDAPVVQAPAPAEQEG